MSESAHSGQAPDVDVDALVAAIDALPRTSVAIFDDDLRCVLARGSVFHQRGLSPASFEGAPLKSTLSEEQWKLIAPICEAALAGESRGLELTGDGGQRWYRIETAPLKRAGKLYGGVVLITDISAEKHEQLERERVQARLMRVYALILQANAGIVAAASPQELYDRLCASAVDDGGFALAWVGELDAGTGTIVVRAASGRTDYLQGIRIAVSAEDPDGRGPTGSALREGRAIVGNNIATDARMAPWRQRALAHGFGASAAFPLLDDARAPSVFTVYAPQAHFFREEERELLEYLASDAAMILRAEREQRELREARARAEIANQTKSEFMAQMSHELRTPLNAVLGFAQLIERDASGETQRARAGQVLRAGRHLLELIDELIDISRIERGQLSLSLEPVLVTDALRDALELIRPSAAERNLALEVDVHRGLYIYVLADKRRLRQVMINLLSNAVKYNRRSGTVWVSFDHGAEGTLRFVVANTGAGIPPERMPDLFVAFERLGREASAERGTGLGLTVSKGLVEAMGGTIGVQSVPGERTTFWAQLRVTEPPEADGAAAQAASSAWDQHESELAGTVLYVEDNPANAVLVRDILAHCPNIRLSVASDGRTGILMARDERPDLILLDVHLPDIDGGVVLDRLRSDPVTAAIPVVAVSADATSEGRHRLLSAGADAYVTKPFDVYELVALVARMLGATSN